MRCIAELSYTERNNEGNLGQLNLTKYSGGKLR